MPQDDRYQLKKQIGQGSIANVYKAFDPRTRRDIAIKILRDEIEVTPQVLQRFLYGAKLIGKLAHPNIVSVYDVGEIKGRPYIAMELLSGQFLSEVVDSRKQLNWQSVVDIAKQLAAALKYAHAHNVIHGDLKPANIAWSQADNKVVITDFNEASLEDICDDVTVIKNKGPGIPKYIAPEKLLGKQIDNRSDLFSLGVILYQLLTGEKPFTADTLAGLTAEYTNTKSKPRSVLLLRPDLHNSLVMLIEKLLETNPKGRYQNCDELLTALDAFSSVAMQAHAKEAADSDGKKLSLGLVAGIFGLLLVGGLAWFFMRPLPDIQSDTGAGKSEPVDKVDVGKVDEAKAKAKEKAADILALESRINQNLSTFECSNLIANVDATHAVTISGYVSVEDDMMSVMDVMDRVPKVSNVSYEITVMQWPLCEIASILSADKHANIDGQSGLSIITESKSYTADDNLELEIKAPARDSYIYVDLYRADGKVIHMSPEDHDNPLLSPAGSPIFVSNKSGNLIADGENLVVAIAAEKPLVIPQRAQQESAQNYLALLHKQIVVKKAKISAKMVIITSTTH